MRLLAEVSLGSGALAVIGGTVGVIAFLAFFTGSQVGLQGYSSLNQLGTGALHRLRLGLPQHPRDRPARGRARARRHGGLRLHRPARGDADLRGGRRARGHGRAVAAVPRDHPDDRRLRRRRPALRARACSRRTARPAFIVVHYFGQSAGTYDHYFHLFLPPIDVLFSFLKVMVFAVVIILIHCYYGYNASGGPAGRGRGRGQGGADLDRRHQHRRLLLLAGGVGRDDDRPDRGVSAWLTSIRAGSVPQGLALAPGQPAYGVAFIARRGPAHRAVGRVLPEALHRRRDGQPAHRPRSARSCRPPRTSSCAA